MNHTGNRRQRRLSRLVCAAVGATLGLSGMSTAFAEDIDTDPSPDALQQKVEQTAAAYEDALAQVDAASAMLEEQQARIADLEARIPEQRARSEAAAREMYKFEQQTPGILDFLLASDGFYDFLSNLEYVNRISAANVAEVNRLNDLKAELDGSIGELEQAKADADKRVDEAERALTAAQEARMEAQRRAEEAARQEAEAAAAAAAAAEAAQKANSGGASEGAESAGVGEPAPEVANPVNDTADWSEDETAFVANWAPRIDAYLEGSPLAGQGTTFARAAWANGVDPRWSPAISFTESSKGSACFLPHNAWGWGGESWGSWEEAINDHVRGLARGYGYTISIEAAKKYCPPNWQAWYDRTLAQMNMI